MSRKMSFKGRRNGWVQPLDILEHEADKFVHD